MKLPNGTFLDMPNITSVDISISPDKSGPIVLMACQRKTGEIQCERIFCEDDEQAEAVVRVILSGMRQYFPTVAVTGGAVT
jgi:hypothetical protein